MPNPFFFGPKITNTRYFVGRKQEIKKIFGFLNTEHTGQIQHVSVVGERRIGKSSLLYHLLQVNGQYLTASERYHFIYLDLQNPRCHTQIGLLCHILDELEIFYPGTPTLEEFYEKIETEHEENGTWAVLLMDEFEKLTTRPQEFTDDFYDSLRALGNHNLLGVVTASQQTLRALADQEKLTSPFFNIFHQITLGEFRDDEVQTFLELGRTGDQPFTADDCRQIIKIAGNHPARLQIVADLVYEAKAEERTLKWKAIKKDAKGEPAFDVQASKWHDHWFFSGLRWLFVTVPRMVGQFFWAVWKYEKATPAAEWIAGIIPIGVALGVLIGVIPWPIVTKYIRRFAELFGG